ncbi:thioredoxin [bacterium]|nr:thioredoxin [bacterium]
MSEVILNEENFKNEIANGVVLVDFFATWCGPCKMLAPVIEELATEFVGKAKIAKLDVDQAGHVAGEFGVQSIPTIIIFKDGQEVDRMIGFQGKEVLMDHINNALA